MAISDRHVAQAGYEQEVAAHWRDWRCYLRARQALLANNDTPDAGAFDRDDEASIVRERANEDLAQLLPASRALFDAVLSYARDTRELPGDAGLADRALVEQLLHEADGYGSNTAPGWGSVPLGTAVDWQWYQIDVSELDGLPDDAAYAVGTRGDKRNQRRRALLGGIAIALLLGVLWMTLPADGAPTAAVRLATVDGKAVALWPTRAITLERAVAAATTLALRQAPRGAWPTDGGSYTLPEQPLRICVPTEQMAGITTARLAASGIEPTRMFVTQPDAAATPDLIIESCVPGEAATWRGVLRDVLDPSYHALGEPVELDAGTQVTLVAVEALGAAQDRSLPVGATRIVLHLDAPAAIDLARYTPTLIASNGLTLQSASSTRQGNQSELRYLVPAPASDPTLVWSLAAPDAATTALWRFTPPALPTRAALLAAQLRVGVPLVTNSATGMQIQLTLTNDGDAPLQLSATDIALQSGDMEIAAPVIAALDTALAPGERRAVNLTLIPPTAPLILEIGAARYQITP